MSMTYRYAMLAIGRKPEWRDVWDTVPCDEEWNPLSFSSQMEADINTWTKKVLDYEIRDKVMYCRLCMSRKEPIVKEIKNKFYVDVIIRRYVVEAPTLLDAKDKAIETFNADREELDLPEDLVISGYQIKAENGTLPFYYTELGAPWNIVR